MSDDPSTPEMRRGDEADPGTPIDALAAFEHAASTDFLGRIRRAIQRRTTVSQIVSFSWTVPFIVLLEFWLALADSLFPKTIRRDQRR